MFQNWEHTQLSTQSTFICNCVQWAQTAHCQKQVRTRVLLTYCQMLLVAVIELPRTKFKFGGGFGAFLWLSVLEMKNFHVFLNLDCW